MDKITAFENLGSVELRVYGDGKDTAIVLKEDEAISLINKLSDATLEARRRKDPLNPVNGNDLFVMTQTIFGEARGETFEGQRAVAHVIMNRVRVAEKEPQKGWWGSTPTEVCLFPWQFSCWNEDDPNRSELLDLDIETRGFKSCLQAASLAFIGKDSDPTKGATHYHAASITPSWAKGEEALATIGNHVFYRVA